eukprot:TRINITY_DN995_c0_g1_i2.p1 TRINITY_DN995_c0_g1~~TRINITY_DN995_c0_g1_i2.p1  ORF type:complete len:598 (-),score=55.55 TRINITY_DN995_c0_g1_i2:48-1841(-)
MAFSSTLLFVAVVGFVEANRTICTEDLCTWYHDHGEVNTKTRVKPGNVRQSHRYRVKVGFAGEGCFPFNSFVYESMPRNGNGRIYSPWDLPNSHTFRGDDGISIEADEGITMAWSQFVYTRAVDIKIFRSDGWPLPSIADVVIRPTSIRYSLWNSVDGGIVIRIPADPNGRKFSVEFADDLYTYITDGIEYAHFMGMPVGTEPRNALLIFASPPLPSDMVPQMHASNTTTMVPGPINTDDWGTLPILYFPPGIYWLNQAASGDAPKFGENHIRLHQNTHWVHFAPGAFVKGAIEYSTKQNFYATGHGVLSGEHYVYQANPTSFYQAIKSDYNSLRMWGHYSLGGDQTWFCVGPTISSPPFNTMDFYGSSDISVKISDYKQVGAFFFQTDGPEMYPNSEVHDVFYHVNDDAIKTYHSGVTLSRATIWKCHNDPIIQMGWDSREVHDVRIDSLNVIHTRYINSDPYVPSAIIGASPFYQGGTADSRKSISMTISNVICEGRCPALFRITPLQNYENFVVTNVSFPDGLQGSGVGLGQSIIPAARGIRMNLEIDHWTVGGQVVTMSNFQSDSLGQLNIDGSYWGQWKIRERTSAVKNYLI